jgi:thymidylate synthase
MLYNQIVPTILGSNISNAWANAFMQCHKSPYGVLSPAIVRINCDSSDNEGMELSGIRQIVDTQLQGMFNKSLIQSNVETVAGTIFPESIWTLAQNDRHKFFQLYEKMLPLIRRKRANKLGVYFERMISYRDNENKKVNQLEHIIETWHSGNHRHSALQAGIFDPRVDHSNARQQGFPCLQQIVFYPNGSNGKDGLSVVAFYANQTLAEKAYGNYLGLYRLGRFMAKEMGLQMKEVVCIASALKLSDSLTKACCEPTIKAIEAVLNNADN